MWVYVVILVIAGAVPAVYHLLHRRFSHELDISERTLIATNFGFFNALFAFMLGFAVATLWGQFIGAEEAVAREANAVNSLYRLALLMPDTRDFRQALARYNQSIAEDEWPDMDKNGTVSEKTHAFYQAVWDQLYLMHPTDAKQQALYSSIVGKMEDLAEFRLRRMILLQGHLYPLMWVILGVGTLFAIVGFFYTGTEKLRLQFVFDFIFIAMILLTLWLISELDQPFNGSVAVSNRPFVIVQERLGQMEQRAAEFRAREEREPRTPTR